MRRFVERLCGLLITGTLVITSLPLTAANTIADTGITLSGTCHVQDYGDTEGTWDASTGTLTLGTRGQSKRVEAITINLENNTGYGGTLQYRVHVQDIGWQDYRIAGEMAGTSGQSKRLEGIEMELTGDLAAYYTVEYAVHIQDYGDAQGFVSDGTLAGTTGESKRLEEVRIRIVPRGTGTSMSVNYRVHRQDYGWESAWAKDGSESGTTGQSKRLEGIEIHLTGNQYSGSIQYHTHVQNIGWESAWSKDGEMSGTQGMSYRLEAIEIELTGEVADYYDVYYRVHAQDYGWLGWAKNGEMSGTSSISKRLEAIQIVLVAKGGAAPGNVAGISSVTSSPSVTHEHDWVAVTIHHDAVTHTEWNYDYSHEGPGLPPKAGHQFVTCDLDHSKCDGVWYDSLGIPYTFADVSFLKVTKVHHDGSWVCNGCGKVFASEADCVEHCENDVCGMQWKAIDSSTGQLVDSWIGAGYGGSYGCDEIITPVEYEVVDQPAWDETIYVCSVCGETKGA